MKEKTKTYETLDEAFERIYGKTAITRKAEPVRKPGAGLSALRVIIRPFRLIIKFFIVGAHSCEPMQNKDIYMGLSGLCMSGYSIVGLLCLNGISSWLTTFGWSDGVVTCTMGFIDIFFILQLIRGFCFIGGYHLFNTGYKLNVTPGAVLYSHKESSDAAYRLRERRAASNRDEIDEFIGYANSKMSTMSNRGKEKYIKELFGGGK